MNDTRRVTGKEFFERQAVSLFLGIQVGKQEDPLEKLMMMLMLM